MLLVLAAQVCPGTGISKILRESGNFSGKMVQLPNACKQSYGLLPAGIEIWRKRKMWFRKKDRKVI